MAALRSPDFSAARPSQYSARDWLIGICEIALDLSEVLAGGLRIAQEFEGIPAGVELRLGDVGTAFGRMSGRDPVRGLGVAEVEELAGDDPALDPPGVAIE